MADLKQEIQGLLEKFSGRSQAFYMAVADLVLDRTSESVKSATPEGDDPAPIKKKRKSRV